MSICKENVDLNKSVLLASVAGLGLWPASASWGCPWWKRRWLFNRPIWELLGNALPGAKAQRFPGKFDSTEGTPLSRFQSDLGLSETLVSILQATALW